MKKTIYKRIPLDLDMWISTPQQIAAKYLGEDILKTHHIIAVTKLYGFPENSEFAHTYNNHEAGTLDDMFNYLVEESGSEKCARCAMKHVKEYPAIAMEEIDDAQS